MKRFLLWLLKDDIKNIVNDLVADEVASIVNSIESIPERDARDAYCFGTHDRLSMITCDIKELVKQYFRYQVVWIKEEAAKEFWKEVGTEKFIDKMIKRINKKQLKGGG